MDNCATSKDIIAAYQKYLHREPESQAMIEDWLSKNLRKSDLEEWFINTDEFKMNAWHKAVLKVRETTFA